MFQITINGNLLSQFSNAKEAFENAGLIIEFAKSGHIISVLSPSGGTLATWIK